MYLMMIIMLTKNLKFREIMNALPNIMEVIEEKRFELFCHLKRMRIIEFRKWYPSVIPRAGREMDSLETVDGVKHGVQRPYKKSAWDRDLCVSKISLDWKTPTITCFQSSDDCSLILEIKLMNLFVDILSITIGMSLWFAPQISEHLP